MRVRITRKHIAQDNEYHAAAEQVSDNLLATLKVKCTDNDVLAGNLDVAIEKVDDLEEENVSLKDEIENLKDGTVQLESGRVTASIAPQVHQITLNDALVTEFDAIQLPDGFNIESFQPELKKMVMYLLEIGFPANADATLVYKPSILELRISTYEENCSCMHAKDFALFLQNLLEIFLQNKGGSLAEFCAMWNLGKDNAILQVNFKACQVLKYVPRVDIYRYVAVSILVPRDTAFVII